MAVTSARPYELKLLADVLLRHFQHHGLAFINTANNTRDVIISIKVEKNSFVARLLIKTFFTGENEDIDGWTSVWGLP